MSFPSFFLWFFTDFGNFLSHLGRATPTFDFVDCIAVRSLSSKLICRPFGQYFQNLIFPSASVESKSPPNIIIIAHKVIFVVPSWDRILSFSDERKILFSTMMQSFQSRTPDDLNLDFIIARAISNSIIKSCHHYFWLPQVINQLKLSKIPQNPFSTLRHRTPTPFHRIAW